MKEELEAKTCVEAYYSNRYDKLLAYVKENAKILGNTKAIKVLKEIGEEE